jgi:hypothetical protein
MLTQLVAEAAARHVNSNDPWAPTFFADFIRDLPNMTMSSMKRTIEKTGLPPSSICIGVAGTKPSA